tara:strand:- start:72 stop:521 length:450 start_codon:yes stop_codon:yes gene_type:complete
MTSWDKCDHDVRPGLIFYRTPERGTRVYFNCLTCWTWVGYDLAEEVIAKRTAGGLDLVVIGSKTGVLEVTDHNKKDARIVELAGDLHALIAEAGYPSKLERLEENIRRLDASTVSALGFLCAETTDRINRLQTALGVARDALNTRKGNK